MGRVEERVLQLEYRGRVSRVFTVVRGTPYESHQRVHANQATDFCGNAVDSSFLVPDQPFAVRLRFDPTSFKATQKSFISRTRSCTHFFLTLEKLRRVRPSNLRKQS